MPSSNQTIVLITGANQGIGLASARALSSLPTYHVLLGSRDPQKGQAAASPLQADGLSVSPITIDLDSDASIQTAVEEVKSKYGRLDVLINNAAVCPYEDVPERKTFRETFETNVFGTAAVTEAFVPLLEKAEVPRVVFVSSSLGSLEQRNDPNDQFSQAICPVYRCSKAALNMLASTYHVRFNAQGWKVNIGCPGFTQTKMNNGRGNHSAEDGAVNIVRLATLGRDGESGTFSNKEGVLPW
jgi:NAD(P)-dependent dehydrogenase (short-subunit alcohol dehydrogenase family)